MWCRSKMAPAISEIRIHDAETEPPLNCRSDSRAVTDRCHRSRVITRADCTYRNTAYPRNCWWRRRTRRSLRERQIGRTQSSPSARYWTKWSLEASGSHRTCSRTRGRLLPVITLWLLPVMATSRSGYFPLWLLPVMATSRYGYFPLWLLPVMATSRYGYFPLWLLPVMATSRYGYFPLWLLPVMATSLYGYIQLWLHPVMATSCYDYCYLYSLNPLWPLLG